jgi:serine protease Do
MKRTYLITALLVAANLSLAAQQAPRARHFIGTPVIVDSESSGHSYLGVGVSDLNSDRIQALKLKDDRGIEITQIDQDAPAGKAGLKQNDVIVGFNGTPVESAEQFKRLMRETPPGRTVSLDIVRDGQQQSVKVQLADRKKFESSMWPREPHDFAFAPPVVAPVPPMPPMPAMPAFPRTWEQTIVRARTTSGVTLESLSPQLGDYFGVKDGEGMLVRSVQKGSTAESAGLRAGDVIVRAGDQKITDSSDWNDALRAARGQKISVVIMRDKKEQTLSMSVPPRRGPDSSALLDDSPEVENAIEAAAGTLDSIGPELEESWENAANALADHQGEINDALNKAMKELHREMIRNRKDINRDVQHSMKLASAEMKAHRGDIERAMREAQRAVDQIHIDWPSDLQ